MYDWMPTKVAICPVHGDWWTPESDHELCPQLGCRVEVYVFTFSHVYDPDSAAAKRGANR